jgi:AbrB family looped-hinge helix DNA binding protein
MSDQTERPRPKECFYGAVTVGERGQIVIPADARKELEIHPGEKLLIWKHPSGQALMLFRMESMREFMKMMMATLERAEQHSAEMSDPIPPTSQE